MLKFIYLQVGSIAFSFNELLISVLNNSLYLMIIHTIRAFLPHFRENVTLTDIIAAYI
jgi:hypothetical protein